MLTDHYSRLFTLFPSWSSRMLWKALLMTITKLEENEETNFICKRTNVRTKESNGDAGKRSSVSVIVQV